MKIVVFVDQLDESGAEKLEQHLTCSFLRDLAENQNEIKVITVHGDEPDDIHKNVEVLRPWPNWGILGSLRLSRLLISYRPQVVHAVAHDFKNSKSFFMATSQLAMMMKLIHHSVTAASIYEIDENDMKNSSLKHWMSSFDALFTNSDIERRLISADPAIRPNQQICTLPPLTLPRASDQPLPLGCRPPWLIIPGSPKDQRDQNILFEALALIAHQELPLQVVFAGGWGNMGVLERRGFLKNIDLRGLGSRVLISPRNFSLVPENWIRESAGIIAHGLSHTGLSLGMALQLARQHHKPLILNTIQAHGDSSPWVHQKNSIIVGNDPHQLATELKRVIQDKKFVKTLLQNLRGEVPTKNSESINQISRVYQSFARLQ